MDGSTYDGDWYNDMRQGHGAFMRPDGYNYKGDWYEDQMHGGVSFFYFNH
jgi:hypothetical protein